MKKKYYQETKQNIHDRIKEEEEERVYFIKPFFNLKRRFYLLIFIKHY